MSKPIPSPHDIPLGLVNLARGLAKLGHQERAHELAEKAIAAAPGDGHVAALAAEVFNHGIPLWHFELIRDEARNAAYDRALRRAVKPGMKVLEIGAGSGILAMMAARAGAAEVITCEANEAVAAVARANIEANGYSDRVKVVAKHSTQLDVQADMGGRADLLVAEIVSNDLLGEEALPLKEHARRELLKPGARLIPAAATARVALAMSGRIEARRVGVVDGLDLSALNRLAPPNWHVSVDSDTLTLASEPKDLISFDFHTAPALAPTEVASVVLTANGGPANCVVQWLRLAMDDDGVYENRPGPDARSCWGLVAHRFSRTVELAEGTPVTVSGACSANALQIWSDLS